MRYNNRFLKIGVLVLLLVALMTVSSRQERLLLQSNGTQTQVALPHAQHSIQQDSKSSMTDSLPVGFERKFTAKPLQEACKEVLDTYAKQSHTDICFSGYIDLCNNVWACIIRRRNAVDCIFVSNTIASNETCVTTVALENTYVEKML